MTEELKIVIRAINDDAKKKLKEVKEGLKGIEEKSKEAREGMKKTFSSIAKGAVAAVGSVVALTTAMVSLGKSTEEFRKAQAKVNTTFQAMGSNSSQAAKTFSDLYRFLGDDATAAETAQSLALITTNEKELAEWSTILQGVYSSMGDKLPINSLAEAANETIKVGKVTSSFADTLNWVGISEDAFNEKLAQTASIEEREVLVRSTLNSVYADSAKLYEINNSAMLKQNESQYRLNVAMAEASKYIVPLITALNNLGATLLTSFGGAIKTACAYLIVFVEWIAQAAQWIGAFFGLMSKSNAVADVGNTIKSATLGTQGLTNGVTGLGNALGDASKQAKELKKQTMGFDELNVVSKQSSSGAASGGVGGGNLSGIGGLGAIDTSGITSGISDVMKELNLDEAREKLKSILKYVGLIALGMGGWRLTLFILDLVEAVKKAGGLKLLLESIGKKGLIALGVTLTIVGFALEASGIIDTIKNELNKANFTEIVSGGGMLIGGGAMIGGYFGAAILGGAIAAIIAGIPMFITGIYDAIKNGLNWLNGVLIPLGSTLAGAGIGAIIGALGGPIGIGIGALVGVCIGLLTDFGIWLWQKFDAIEEWFLNLPTWGQIGIGALVAVATGALMILTSGAFLLPAAIVVVITAIKTEFFGLIDWFKSNIIEPLSKAANWIYTTILEPILQSLGKVFQYAKEKYTEIKEGVISSVKPIIDKVTEIYLKLKEIFQALWGAFKEYCWNPIADKVTSFYAKNIQPTVDKVKAAFKYIWNEFKTMVYDKIVEKVADIKLKIETFGKGIVDIIAGTLKATINGIFWTIETFLNKFIRGLNSAISLINKIPNVNISPVKELSIPRLATGGILNRESLFIGGEGNKKEAVLPLEQNTEWMDILADRIANRNIPPSKIVLKVGEKEIGWASINGINSITRQTGELPLVLA